MRRASCRPGCADCCVGGITVWRVERDRIGTAPRPSEGSGRTDRCPFLDAASRCTIYDRRPVVCRLWGLPQRIDGSISCCDNNFREPPEPGNLAAPDVIDLDTTLTALAAINHVYCAAHGLDPAERLPLAP